MVGLAVITGVPLLLVPFTTTIVLVMGSPESQQAQPRNIICGHVISALCGLVVLTLLGSNVYLAGLAVGLSIALMQLTRTLHPPAGMDALLMVTAKLPSSYVLMPVLSGGILLVAFAYAFHHLTAPGRWPHSWW